MEFNKDGVLDPGIYDMSWEEFYKRFSFTKRRRELLEGLEKVIEILKNNHCTEIYIDGSFVTEKLEPNDWDACFECEAKYQLDIWRAYPFKDKDEQKEKYNGELYFASNEADAYGTRFLDFFQQITNTPKRKGIVRIKLNSHDT